MASNFIYTSLVLYIYILFRYNIYISEYLNFFVCGYSVCIVCDVHKYTSVRVGTIDLYWWINDLLLGSS